MLRNLSYVAYKRVDAEGTGSQRAVCQIGFVQARFPASSIIVSLSHGDGDSFSKGRMLCVIDLPWRTTVGVLLP